MLLNFNGISHDFNRNNIVFLMYSQQVNCFKTSAAEFHFHSNGKSRTGTSLRVCLFSFPGDQCLVEQNLAKRCRETFLLKKFPQYLIVFDRTLSKYLL